MGPLDWLPNIHSSLSLPSLSHRKSASRIHRRADPSRMRRSATCSLCHQGMPSGSRCYRFPKTVPAAIAALKPHIRQSVFPHKFCRGCWVWIHNLSICWKCGETVSRQEGRVSFGWCWWHWACVSCLFCRVCDFFHLFRRLKGRIYHRELECEDVRTGKNRFDDEIPQSNDFAPVLCRHLFLPPPGYPSPRT